MNAKMLSEATRSWESLHQGVDPDVLPRITTLAKFMFEDGYRYAMKVLSKHNKDDQDIAKNMNDKLSYDE